MGFRIDITGQNFGRWQVLQVSERRDKTRAIFWECQCSCGTRREVDGRSLRSGLSTSCGCARNEVTSKRSFKHGISGTKAYGRERQNLREAAKLQRTPPWSDLDRIREIYRDCPEGLAVDHIIPLRGRKVSGLHVPENLQYLTKSENSRKRNKFEPYIELALPD